MLVVVGLTLVLVGCVAAIHPKLRATAIHVAMAGAAIVVIGVVLVACS